VALPNSTSRGLVKRVRPFRHVSIQDQWKGVWRRSYRETRALIVNENIPGGGDGFASLASVALVGGPIRCHSPRVFLGA
jgi:hypothetical protein